MSVRNGSAIGRFHGAAATNGQAIPEKVVTRETKQEGACRRWLRKACPCCCRRQSSSYDVMNELATVVKDEEKLSPSPEPPRPQTGDKELEGETASSEQHLCNKVQNDESTRSKNDGSKLQNR